MTNIEALVTLVCKLPEIELREFLEGVAGHCEREKLDHLVEASFGSIYNEELDELKDSYRDLEIENERLDEKVDRLTDEVDELKEKIEELKDKES